MLIITYYWPPAGGPGVQRWLKFAKYLPDFGVIPIVFTPENPSYPVVDSSLLKEVPKDLKVLKLKIWEPYKIAEFLNPKNKDYKAGHFEKPGKQSFFTRLSVFLRGNFFIPDARKFWVGPSVKFLNEYLKIHPVDFIISTGPPHSIHLIAMELKKKNNGLKWIADFRDPWTQISYHSELKLTHFAQTKHQKIEKSVFRSADFVIATSYTDANNYRQLGAARVEVITNGFEESDFKPEKKKKNIKFKVTYSGGLEIARNPIAVWKALKELSDEQPDFEESVELNFYGSLSTEVQESVSENQLSKFVVNHGYVLHSEAINGISDADLLLLTNFPDEKSKGIIPGKLFEYLATQNPILALGPEGGDVAIILSRTGGGEYFTHSEKDKIKEFIYKVFRNWKMETTNDDSIEYKSFSRHSLTEKLARIINGPL